MDQTTSLGRTTVLPALAVSFLDEKAVSKQLSIPVATLQRWRWQGTGPKYHKFGRLVRYAQSDIEMFIQASQPNEN